MDTNLTTRSIVASPASRNGSDGTQNFHIVWPREIQGVFALPPKSLQLGRSSSGEGAVALPHSTVSRNHLEVMWNASEKCHYIRDLGSRNGSWVNGVPVGDTLVKVTCGDVIRMGDVLSVIHRNPNLDEQSQLNIPGLAPGMVQLRGKLRSAAPDPSPALILGETGAGKEFVARELHRLSGRQGKLVSLNCAVLNAQLIESSLFGHVKGAFTGASTAQQGLFEAAHGGTLFLDEIGELPIELQPKLLRAIQEQEIRPVGSTTPRKINVRIVAATNRDLVGMIGENTFRRDLYARLALWVLELPPLRERRSDIPLWIHQMFQQWCEERQVRAPELQVTGAGMERLLLYSWSENLRGIHRFVHHMALHASSGTPLHERDLPDWIVGDDVPSGEARDADITAPIQAPPSPPVEKRSKPETREEMERVFVENERSVRATSRYFGRDRKQIYRWLDSFGIERE